MGAAIAAIRTRQITQTQSNIAVGSVWFQAVLVSGKLPVPLPSALFPRKEISQHSSCRATTGTADVDSLSFGHIFRTSALATSASDLADQQGITSSLLPNKRGLVVNPGPLHLEASQPPELPAGAREVLFLSGLPSGSRARVLPACLKHHIVNSYPNSSSSSHTC